jgi:hypothetical protein
MVKAQEYNSGDLDREELITLIHKNSPNIIPLLKQDTTALPLYELQHLHQLSELEASAKELCGSYANALSAYSVKAFKMLQTNLKELKLSEKDQKIANNIYKQTILIGVTKASKKLLEPLAKGEGYLYNKILSEQTIDILNSILEFKKSIDQQFPGLSDKIIAAAIPAITALVSTYAPPVGLVLKTTGVLSKAAEYIKTDNLEKTVEKMRTDLGKIEQTKHLAEAQELGTKLSELAETIGVSAESLQKSGITLKNIKEVTQEVANNPEAAEFLKEVCKYTEKHVPSSKKEVEELFENIKQDAVKELEKNGASKEVIEDFKEMFKEESINAELHIKDAAQPEMPAFDKIAALQKGADLMEKAQEKIKKTLSKKHPSEKTAIAAAVKSVDTNIKTKVRGDLEGVASKMTSTTKAKDLAKKHLGAGLANEVAIKRSLAKNKEEIQAR